jgi:hypothetical protein
MQLVQNETSLLKTYHNYFLPVHGTDSQLGREELAPKQAKTFMGQTSLNLIVKLSFLFTLLYAVFENNQWLRQ